VFARFFKKNLFTLAISLLFIFHNTNLKAANDTKETVDLSSFAFSSYLGSGFYTTSGQDVFVLQLPFSFTIKPKTETEAGWLLKLPITIGLINVDNKNVTQNNPKLNDIATFTFLPGIEYQRPITANWTLIPFADYGFARDTSNTENVLVIGSGIKSYYNLHLKDSMITLGNRFLYARARNKRADTTADYSLIETGLNYRLTTGHSFKGDPLYTNLYYIYFYYPNNLVLLNQTDNPVKVTAEHEVGFTFSNLPDFLFFDKPQIGLGVRTGNGVTVYRLVFGMPF